MKRIGKMSCALFLSGLIGLQGIPLHSWNLEFGGVYVAEAKSNGPEITLRYESYITAGAQLREYEWKSERGGEKVSATARVIVVDLKHPFVNLDVMTGRDGQFTKRATVRQMAVETGAVAGINGDFYGMTAEGAPLGPQVSAGRLVSSPSQLQGMYAFGVTKDRVPLIERFHFHGTVTAPNGQTYPLAGINKTYYFTEPDGTHSHVDAIYLYTPEWGSVNRANDGYTTPTEVLVRNGVVERISIGQALPEVPPADGYILRASRKAADFIVNNFQVGDPIIVDYELVPVNPNVNVRSEDLQMLIGGHTLLVQDGKPAAYTRDVTSIGGYRARTGIGYSRDGRYVYLITVDRSGSSLGMSLNEFRQFMVDIGVWKGLNLDGGGSTQLVARPLGEFDARLANRPEGGSERLVVNGIGVYTTAPPGALKDFVPRGNQTLLIGESAPFELKAYDEYYNPIDVSAQEVEWSISNDAGTFEGNVLTALKPGVAEVTARSGNLRRSTQVEIIGRDQIERMTFVSGEAVLEEGQSYDLTVELVTQSGLKRQVPIDLIDWEFYGIKGSIRDGRFHVDKIVSPDGAGYIVARYDGFGTMRALVPGGKEKWLTGFEQERPSVHFTGYPDGVSGSVAIQGGVAGKAAGDHALYLRYDFNGGHGTRAAYAVLNGEKGLPVPGEPYRMKLDVAGDESGNWIRAEFADADGKKHLVDITRNTDWSGWKTITVDLAPYGMKYPVRLTRLYVANPEQGQETRAMEGAVAFDNLHFVGAYQPQAAAGEVTLTVGKPSMHINGEAHALDQPAVIVNGSTLVPLRFVTDALGGQIGWNNTEKRVTVLNRKQLIDMWIGQNEMTINGKRYDASVKPEIRNGRTMVPLRLISESFGWEVHWDNKTKTVRLRG